MDVTFYRNWKAFPHTRAEDDLIVVGVNPNGPDEGGNYEFTIAHVGTSGPRDPIGLQVRIFDDGWRAFSDLPGFFDLLAGLDQSASAGPSPYTLDHLIPSLLALGWRDRTSEFTSAHEHVHGCLSCGARL